MWIFSESGYFNWKNSPAWNFFKQLDTHWLCQMGLFYARKTMQLKLGLISISCAGAKFLCNRSGRIVTSKSIFLKNDVIYQNLSKQPFLRWTSGWTQHFGNSRFCAQRNLKLCFEIEKRDWAKLKLYFFQRDKSLLERGSEDGFPVNNRIGSIILPRAIQKSWQLFVVRWYFGLLLTKSSPWR